MAVFTRRDMLRATGLGLWGVSASGWLPVLADAAAATRRVAVSGGGLRRRQCVLLWMPGGPSQTDTFDLKPRHANGGEFREIATSVPGLGISEHLPKLAGLAEHLAIIRGLSTKEGDHGRGTFLMRTGHQPSGDPIKYPSIGSTLSKALGDEDAEVPNYVSIGPYAAFNPAAFGPGFLGPRYAPLTVGSSAAQPAARNAAQPAARNAAPGAGGSAVSTRYAELGVDDLHPPGGVAPARNEGRLALWRSLQTGFVSRHRSAAPLAHETVYQRAVRMMRSEAALAFDLSSEPDAVRDAYGRGRFGQGCLMARRLIERGVPFVEVALGGVSDGGLGWDTHQNNFRLVRNLSAELDAGWATLMSELADRGLLETTTIVWMGEFGRTPKINSNAGRDHFPNAWSCVLAGGGVHGGQAYGRTSDDGMTVDDGKVDVGDVLATLAAALGIDPAAQNVSEMGRPVKLAEGQPVKAILEG